ncbi:MAG: hypothetical protein C5B59_08070 [Bacteroidetes bacterium]|nr:MAG: hypothetical protein C5B59_08070 [Bacteroidota bacterium]
MNNNGGIWVKEMWRNIDHYDGFYQVSCFGNIRRMPKMINSWFGGRIWKGRILAPLIRHETHRDSVIILWF